MGIRSRRVGGVTQSGSDLTVDDDGDGGDRLGDALLVLDDLAAVLELVANGGDILAEPARLRVEQLREIRRTLRVREADPPNLDYGRGEWFTDLAWLLTNQDLTGALIGQATREGGPWLWFTQISHDGTSWTSEREDRPGAGLEDGPADADKAARHFLDRRLAQLAGEADEYDVEDSWLRVTIWHAHRTGDSTGNGSRLAERAAEFTSSLAPLGHLLQVENLDPNAVAVATPRQVNHAASAEQPD